MSKVETKSSADPWSIQKVIGAPSICRNTLRQISPIQIARFASRAAILVAIFWGKRYQMFDKPSVGQVLQTRKRMDLEDLLRWVTAKTTYETSKRNKSPSAACIEEISSMNRHRPGLCFAFGKKSTRAPKPKKAAEKRLYTHTDPEWDHPNVGLCTGRSSYSR
jgi:hypothetical protein